MSVLFQRSEKTPSILHSFFLVLSLCLYVGCGDNDSDSSPETAASGSSGVEITIDSCFSMDYVHPDPACQKIMANLVIDALNTKYSTTYEKIGYKADAEIKKQDKQDGLKVTTLVTVGDSLLSGYRQMDATKSTDAEHVKYYYTDDNFGLYLAKSLGLTTGTTDDAEYRYPTTDNKDMEVSATAAISRGTIKNASNTKAFHHLAFPGIPLAGLVDGAGFAQLSQIPSLANSIQLWKQVLRQQAIGVNTQVAALKPDLLVINAGNNDLLGPATYENMAFTSKTDFQNYYQGFLTGTATGDTKVVMFKVADVGGAPFFDLKQTYNNMPELVPSANAKALATLLNADLYGQTDDSVEAVGTQTTRKLDLTKDKLKLTALTELLDGKGANQANPLSDSVWLSETELSSINAKYNEYNELISTIAASADYKDRAMVVDTASDLKALVSAGKVTK